MGAFRPTSLGETLMPVITGVQRALREIALNRGTSSSEVGEAPGHHGAMPATYEADVATSESHFAALELELRAPDGTVVATEWIGVQDTEELIRWSDQMEAKFPERYEVGTHDSEIEAAVARDMELIDAWFEEREESDEPWEADEDRGEFPRYQLSVQLKEPL